jgi:thiol-disulfide isomerase/thioredoxin
MVFVDQFFKMYFDIKKIKFDNFYILVFVFNFVCLFPVIKDFSIRLLFIGIIYFFIGVKLFRQKPFNDFKGFLIILFPFIFFHTITAYQNHFETRTYGGIPFLLWSIITSFLVINVYKANRKIFLITSCTYLSLLLICSLFLSNYYNFLNYKKSDLLNKDLSAESVISNHKEISLNKFKGKILIIDFWSTNCLPCINGFEKFNELKKSNQLNKELKFITINIPNSSNKNRIEEMIDKYNLDSFIASDKLKDKVNSHGVPLYLIVSSELKIKYTGTLNFGKFEFYNNFYNIINDIKDEKN